MNSRRTRTGALLAVVASILIVLGLSASVASAEYLGHYYSSTFSGTGTSKLGFIEHLAVDSSGGPSNGDVYVGDLRNYRVVKFDQEGNFILMFGDEVNATTGGDVCTAVSGDTCKEGIQGGGSQQLGGIETMAVDSSSGPSSGDIYVSEFNSGTIRKYDESGHLITGWANGGVLTGASSPSGPFRFIEGITVDSDGNLDVLNESDFEQPGRVVRFEEDGTPYPDLIASCRREEKRTGLGVSPSGTYFYKLNNSGRVQRFTGEPGGCVEVQSKTEYSEGSRGLAVDPVRGSVFASARTLSGLTEMAEYVVNGADEPLDSSGNPCPPVNLVGQESAGCPATHKFGKGLFSGKGFSEGTGIGVASQTNTVYVSRSEVGPVGQVLIFKALELPKLTVDPASNVEPTTATVSGDIDPDGAGEVSKCFFEFGPTTSYGNTIPCNQSVPISAPTHVDADLSKLTSGRLYHFRLAAVNGSGTQHSQDRILTTSAPPSVNSFAATDLTATTAILHAVIVPNSKETEYHFEYGTGTSYGLNIPVPAEHIGDGQDPVEVVKEVTGLAHSTYHFRVVATNSLGTTYSEDQSFEFFPPACPNRTVRQQTGSDYLPDCRAYELVSPADAGNVIFEPEARVPAPTYATNPDRFMFGGSLGLVTGTNAPNEEDKYLATRTASGWETKYVGQKGDEALAVCNLEGDRSLSIFISVICGPYFPGVAQPPQNVPFVWDSNGNPLGRWPATAPVIPNADAVKGSFQPSPDFSHLAFSSEDIAFAPGGVIDAPGSAYDYDTATGTTKIISLTASGSDIEQEPGNSGSAESIYFPVAGTDGLGSDSSHPSVSTDGSHVLMSTWGGPPAEPRPMRLYMRVDDAVTYEVSRETDVFYVGMTEGGSKVFFLSGQKLTADDHDTSVDLYMWSEAGDTLTRVSAGEGEAGDVDSCGVSWASGCGVAVPQSENYFHHTIDSPIAAQSGDIYFYSPERLVGVDAPPNERNLYVFHEEEIQYVATTDALSRMQITPDGRFTAFIGKAQMTSFDNKGFAEMYTYEPGRRLIHCVSCSTEGNPPTGNVAGSLSGRFIADDGRAFFYTTDGLVPTDTNKLHDVYEFSDGRPQLITSGTGSQDTIVLKFSGKGERAVGLQAVTADGTDVYFSTYDNLIAQDQNGQFIKYYDARTGGGFPTTAPLQPCAAADECHGSGSSPPLPDPITSEGDLGAGGNFTSNTKPGKAKRHKKTARHKKAARHGKARRHGARKGRAGR